MKKLIALLLALCMLTMLCACGTGTEAEDQSKETEKQTEAQNDVSSDTQTEPQTDLPENPTIAEDEVVVALKQILGNAISFNDYSVEVDEEEVDLDLLEAAPINFDYTISLDDGTTITLPMIYGEFLDVGWTNKTAWKEQAEANSSGYGLHANANGDTVSIGVVNPTDETMELADIWINSVNVGGSSNSAGFNVCGISSGSSIADVIAALGNPTSIYYTCEEDYEALSLNYNTPEFALTFEIDIETALVYYVGCSISNTLID